MSYTDWPAIVQKINEQYGTHFNPNAPGPALKFLTDRYHGCASQAGTAAGVSQNVMYRACKRFGIETLHRYGPKVSWPECLIRINRLCNAAYSMDDIAQALRAIIDMKGGYKQAATAIGCGETAIRRRAKQLGIYSPYYNGKRPSEAVLPPAVSVIDIVAWHKSGMTKSPCATCPIGRGTKNRPECDECEARYEYAMISADLPSRRCVDLFRESEHARTRRASACI